MKNNPIQKTRHHIVPRSRKTRGILGICKVPRLQHELYHHLFGNMKPEEIVNWLNATFWNGMFYIQIKQK